jgi:15-cis-phytoene synthase
MSGRDTNFYYSFLVLPAAQRQAIIAVWDFCRAVDDAVDEAQPPVGPSEKSDADGGACAELAKWRAELGRCFSNGEPCTAQGRRLQPFIGRFNLPRDAFERVIDGVEMDLGERTYQTFAELREYCLRVASAVGHVCIAIFGCDDQAARDYATDLGIALQLTNIIRDVKTDLDRGRVYLPTEDLQRFGCDADSLRAATVTEPVRRLLAFECARARQFYASAERLLTTANRRRLVAARIMGAIYFAILVRIERRGHDVFSGVVRVPRPRRAAIAAATWAKTVAGL